jgi:hypothetical protein
MIKAFKPQDRKQIKQYIAGRSSFYFIVLRKECLVGMSFGVRISERSDHDSVSGADFRIRMFV